MPGIESKLDEITALLREIASHQNARAPRLMRLSEAARYLHVSPWQLRRLIARGHLPVVKVHDTTGHAPTMVDVRDLDNYIETHKD